MEDCEDLKKIDDIIKKHKVEAQDPDEIEYSEFIDYDDNPNDGDDLNEIEDYEIPNFTNSDITKFTSYNQSDFFLSESEKKVIELCTDPDLKELLLLNRTKNIQLIQVYKKLKDLLVECQDNIEVYEQKIKAEKENCIIGKKVHPKIWRMGIPYFKTADDYPCPRNPDVIQKHKEGELFFYDMTPSYKWSERYMNRLFKGVAFHYKVHRQTEIELQISDLLRSRKQIRIKDKINQIEETLNDLNEKLDDIKNNEIVVYPNLDEEHLIDWEKISMQLFSVRYTADDCRTFWRIYLHPKINKSPWKAEENKKLKQLAKKYNYQNWDKIAEELGGNRTGFIACVHYFCKINIPRFGKFSPEEDKLLLQLVEQYKQGAYIPFTKIAHHFSSRTRGQLFFRYKYYLSCKEGISRGRFTQAEDILILVLVNRFGHKFVKCQKYFPHRSVIQIKARYSSNLKGAIKKGSFTREEDEAIIEYVEKNSTKNWEGLVSRLNRSGGQIRQRYKTLQSFQFDLDNVPRRRYAGLSYDTEYDYLRLMADKFRNCEKIPTLEEITGLLQSSPKPAPSLFEPLSVVRKRGRKRTVEGGIHSNCEDSDALLPSLVVDDLITSFFCDTLSLDVQSQVTKEHISKAASSVNGILSTLMAELHIPKDFESDERLDSIDIGIINILKNPKQMTKNNEYIIKSDELQIGKLIPPNLNTIVGIRSLLIKNEMYKAKCEKRASLCQDFKKENNEKQILWRINHHLSSQTEQIGNELISERNLLFNRFVSIFKFPAIMALLAPSKALEERISKISEPVTIKSYQRNRNRTGSKPTQPKNCDDLIQNKLNKETVSTIKTYKRNTKQAPPPLEQVDQPREEPVIKKEKLTMAEKLKRQIDQTLQDLSACPPAKKPYHETTKPFNSAISFSCYRVDKIVPKVVEIIDTPNLLPVVKNKSYSRKPNIKKSQPDPVVIKNEISCSEDSQKSFNFGKGELILESVSPDSSVQGSPRAESQDVEDLKLLDAILKQEKHVEETFDF